MAVLTYKARVDEEGNLLIPHTELPAGLEVAVSISVPDPDEKSLREMLDKELGEFWNIARPAFSFWDNPSDNELWG
jgi:hypothetical protein